MKIKILGGLLVAALAITSMAQAQDRTPVLNHRHDNQESGANQGIRSAESRYYEADHMRADDRSAAGQRNREQATDRMNGGERSYLRQDENRANRTIYRDRHDDDER